MNTRKKHNERKERRQKRSRAKIYGTASIPRLVVFRSNRTITTQLIDDEKGRTVAYAAATELAVSEKKKSKVEQALLVGELLAKKALGLKIKRAVFDRREYRYHGRVQALADGARKGGLKI